MNLEDHVGDIIRKARQMTNISLEAAAQAAGMSESDLAQLEETGRATKPVNYAALAQIVGLNSSKLERIAGGWTPVDPDLGQWRELRVISTVAHGNAVNCYVVWDEVSREAALFDTGWDADPVLEILRANHLHLRHVFITHSHADHVSALDAIRQAFPVARMHSNAATAAPQHRNRANDCIQLGSLRITNRETPGHAEDGVTYIIGNWPEDAPHVAIVGDALFAGSIGRGNQSWDLARQKVREQILSLPPETLICPGHGSLTTVSEEKNNNPFF